MVANLRLSLIDTDSRRRSRMLLSCYLPRMKNHSEAADNLFLRNPFPLPFFCNFFIFRSEGTKTKNMRRRYSMKSSKRSFLFSSLNSCLTKEFGSVAIFTHHQRQITQHSTGETLNKTDYGDIFAINYRPIVFSTWRRVHVFVSASPPPTATGLETALQLHHVPEWSINHESRCPVFSA